MKPRLRLIPRFSSPSSFGLAASCAFLVVLTPMWILTVLISKPGSGLNVTVLAPGAKPVTGDLLPAPVVVHLEYVRPDVPPRVHINSITASWESLPVVLRQELRTRPPSWPVYFSADDDLHWQEVVRAIDIIKGEHARVVLLTTDPAKQKALTTKDTK